MIRLQFAYSKITRTVYDSCIISRHAVRFRASNSHNKSNTEAKTAKLYSDHVELGVKYSIFEKHIVISMSDIAAHVSINPLMYAVLFLERHLYKSYISVDREVNAITKVAMVISGSLPV